MRAPAVSVVMPACNSEGTIAEAIESVMAQSFGDWVLYVVDDGSTDGTVGVVNRMANRDGRIVLVPLAKNVGPARARNIALDLTASEYCAFLDADDVWYPGKLERQLAEMERGADLCCTSYRRIDEAGRAVGAVAVPRDCSYERLVWDNFIGCSTVLVRTSALAGRRFSSEWLHEDYVLWLDLLQGGASCTGVRDVLAAHRVRRGSRSRNKLRAARGRWRIYRDKLGLPPLASSACFARYAAAAVARRLLPARIPGGGLDG